MTRNEEIVGKGAGRDERIVDTFIVRENDGSDSSLSGIGEVG